MDRLDAMRTFVRVVETGSFSAVARELGVGQPAVSKQIAALEEHLRAQLVLRTTRRVRITQAGTAFYEAAARLVAELDAAMAHAGRGEAAPSGLVRVTVAPVFGRLYVVPRLPALFARYPQLSVELLVSAKAVNLIEDNVDLAIRNGALADSSLVARAVGSTPLLTVASKAYLAARGEPQTPRDLEEHSRIVFVGGGAPRVWRFAGPGGKAVHHAQGSFQTNDADQIRAAILGDLGLAHVPGWLVAPELAAGTVRAVLREYEPPPVPISAVRPGGRKLSRKVRVLVDFLMASFATEPMLGVRSAGASSSWE